MSLNLPDRASIEYLKKHAKERLAALRATAPGAQLADAQLIVARDYGFPSWRALKAELDRRRAPNVAAFIQACRTGNVPALRQLLTTDPDLARERVASGSTGLHLAARHPEALRVLIAHGADPNARDTGDRATPLHFAAANGDIDSVLVLLDAGADVHGAGDLHQGDVIGWAARPGNEAVVDLLLSRGARHHIFSAMALRDRDLVQALVERDPECLSRRRSRFENGQTPLHASFAPPDGLGYLAGEPDHAMLALLNELGADVEAQDDRGRTPLALAILRGDHEAMRLLRAAGATEPASASPAEMGSTRQALASAATSITHSSPMLFVRDMRATVRWYQSIGFSIADQYEDGNELMFARLTFGKSEITLSPGGDPGPRDVRLWFITDRVQELYDLLRQRQLRATTDVSTSNDDEPQVRFQEDLYTPFYGGRQFSIQDNNGLTLVFWQPG